MVSATSPETPSEINEQFKRLHIATETRTQAELAECLGIRQASISVAKKRRRIPVDWLLTLLVSRKVNPNWILTGQGSRFMWSKPKGYEGIGAEREKAEATRILRSFSSKVLAEELFRRIAIAEAKKSAQG